MQTWPLSIRRVGKVDMAFIPSRMFDSVQEASGIDVGWGYGGGCGNVSSLAKRGSDGNRSHHYAIILIFLSYFAISFVFYTGSNTIFNMLFNCSKRN